MDDSPATVTVSSELTPLTPPKLCPFDLGNGAICASPKHFARGYCEKHYRALSRAGAFAPDDTPQASAHHQVLTNLRSVKRARRKLVKLAPMFVDHLLTASQNAAQKGDAGPAQWAILHTRVLEPIATKTTAQGDENKLTINVGVKVSGTPNQ